MVNYIELFSLETYTIFFRIIVATFLCGVIGLEREFNNHPAGFRTHLLVGMGSCLMMILSLYGFNGYIESNGNIRFDPARIPSYVISGIGFLGGGTILVKGATVRGLTTAASIWIVAGLGLVIGAGMYVAALFTTIMVLMCLIFLNRLEKYMNSKKLRRKIKVVIKSNKGKVDQVIKKLNTYNLKITKVMLTECHKNSEGLVTLNYTIDVNMPTIEQHVIERIIVENPEIEKIY